MKNQINPILAECIKNNMNYCHVIEVSDIYELQTIIDNIADEGWSQVELMEFFNTIEIYCICEENEIEVTEFSTDDYINELF